MAPELLPVVRVCPLERVEDGPEIVTGSAVATDFAGHLASGPAREFFHRFDELQVRVFHQESDRGAVGAAAEAVVELLVRDYGERGRLLVVERTARLVFLAGALERDVVLDDLDDVGRRDEVVYEGLGDPPRHGVDDVEGSAGRGPGEAISRTAGL